MSVIASNRDSGDSNRLREKLERYLQRLRCKSRRNVDRLQIFEVTAIPLSILDEKTG